MSDFTKFVYKLLIILLAPSIATIGYAISKGDWVSYSYLWFGIPIFVIILMIILIVIRFRQIRPPNTRSVFSGVHEYPTRAKHPHADVIWYIGIRDLAMSSSDIEVKTPPRCPICETELNQKSSFWGKFVWSCPRGDFKKTGMKSFLDVVDDVEKIVRREWERNNRSY